MRKKPFSSTADKVLSPNKASAWIKKFQKSGRRVVFTNGCFDLLHRGHISYLEEARTLGDALIIALNSDASVRKLKGPSRPIVSLRDRARVIAGLACVDAVTWFSEDTPEKIIKNLLPKILVKGGDWSVDKIVGAEVVWKNGGEVLSLSFVKGHSSTRLIEKSRCPK